MSDDRVDLIEMRLREALDVQLIEIEDESHRHAGHPGARAGGGHYNVLVVSADFNGRSRIERHRLVLDALSDAIRPDTIHALSIRALAPGEHHREPGHR